MITLTTAQLNAWIMLLLWPFARILALIATAPITSSAQFPVTAKIGLAVLVTVLVAPTLPAAPAVDPDSLSGLALLVRETLFGIGMGLAMRAIFAGIVMAGDVIGLQMGLGFAQFYDAQTSAQVQVVGQFMNLLAMLVFLSINGHLLLIATLIHSFHAVPVDSAKSLADTMMNFVLFGGMIMQAAVLLSLPLIATLLVTNSALGVLSRAAPQLNVFAIGFPITILTGFVVLLLTLPYWIPAFEQLFDMGLQAMSQTAGAIPR